MTRTVLVTGGTKGIGRAVAERFAAAGADVCITGRRIDTVEAAAKELGVRGLACDATDPHAVEELAARFPTLDVLVNAAGGLGIAAPGPPGESALATVLAEWQADLELNLLSAVLTVTALKPRLAEGGAVISVGSIGAERRGGSYGAAKAALAAWHAMLSAEIAPRGITANVVSPGYVAGTEFFQGRMTEAREQGLIADTHNKKAGAPRDIAETVFFLASDGARHITGQTIHVNGGAFTTR
jgi:3-oxoacyl-[acyl-carrier protein] reductase